jgi:hypothetical protein
MPARYDDDEDDDYDDRPRKRKKKPRKKGGPPVMLFVALGAGLLVAVGVAVGGYLLFAGKKGGGVLGGGLLGPVAPAGYSTVRDADGGFQVFLPGVAHKARTIVNGQEVDSKTKAVWASIIDNGQSQAWVTSAPLPAGYTPGSTPEHLERLLKMGEGGIDAPWNDVVSKGPKTLDGKPAFELRYRYKPDWMGRGGGGGEDMSNRNQTVLCVTHDGKRWYVVKLERKGQMPDEETVKTVYESFKFI